MKLLLDARNKIVNITDDIRKEVQEGIVFWVCGYTRFLDNGYTVAEVNEVPIEIIPEKYFYINNEFVKNPNWSNTPEEISKLQKENAELKSELSLLQEVVNEMLLGV